MFKLAHVGIVVKDLEKSLQFYLEVLGFTAAATTESEQLRLACIDTGNGIIELLHYKKEQQPERHAGIVDHIAFTVKNMDEALTRLKEYGMAVSLAPPLLTPAGHKYLFFPGPDGERIELVEDCVMDMGEVAKNNN